VHITQWLRFFICSPNRFMVIHNLLTVNCCENSCYDFSRQTHRAIVFEALCQCYKHTNNNASNQKILLVNNTHWPLYCTVHVYIVSTSFCDRVWFFWEVNDSLYIFLLVEYTFIFLCIFIDVGDHIKNSFVLILSQHRDLHRHAFVFNYWMWEVVFRVFFILVVLEMSGVISLDMAGS
jgi:hypothetical protein